MANEELQSDGVSTGAQTHNSFARSSVLKFFQFKLPHFPLFSLCSRSAHDKASCPYILEEFAHGKYSNPDTTVFMTVAFHLIAQFFASGSSRFLNYAEEGERKEGQGRGYS